MPPPIEVMGAGGYAALVAPVLSEFHEPPTVVGHSFGGRVGLALAADHPGAVRRLVLTGVPLLREAGAGRPAIGYRLLRFGHRVGLVSDQRLEGIRRRRGSADYRAATGIMRDVLVKTVNESYRAELDRVDVPVRMVWGSEDHEASLDQANEAVGILHSRGIDCRIEVIQGVGHFVPTEAPERIRPYLTDEDWS